jgi:hypothetical protein
MPLFLLTFLLHGLIAWRLVPAWDGWPLTQWGLAAGLALNALLMPAGFAARRVSRRLARGLTWAGYLGLGLLS